MNETTVESEAASYRVALDEFPEFASQIGILISCFALIESYMHHLVSRTTGIDESDAFQIAGSYQTFGPRIDLLETLLKKRDPTASQVQTAKYFISALREATRIRNAYAHGTYSLSFVGGDYSPTAERVITVTSYLYDAKRKKPESFERTLDQVIAEVARIKFITCELHAYIYRNEIPCT